MFNHTTTSDRAIIETLEQSQEKGFRMLLAKYQEPVYWHIRRLVVSHDDAQDALQETFVRIFRSLHQYKGDCSFRSWMYRIAANEALRIIVLALITSVLTLQAQVSEKQRISREQLAEKQAQHIAHDLALDDATTAKFVATYHEYQKELWAIGPRPKRAKGNAQSEEQAEAQMQQQFTRSQRILDLREKYYKKYSTFLTQRQIQCVYEIERGMRKKLMQRRAAGKKEHQGNVQRPTNKE